MLARPVFLAETALMEERCRVSVETSVRDGGAWTKDFRRRNVFSGNETTPVKEKKKERKKEKGGCRCKTVRTVSTRETRGAARDGGSGDDSQCGFRLQTKEKEARTNALARVSLSYRN